MYSAKCLSTFTDSLLAVCGVPRREGGQVLLLPVPERLHHEEQENRALRLVQGSAAHFLQRKEKYCFPSLVKLETMFYIQRL